MQGLGLITHNLDPESVLELVVLRQAYRQLSVVDLVALLLAEMLGANLVTGDRRLNDLAKARRLPVHGVLWLLDEMVLQQVLTNTQAAEALLKMLAQGARLPQVECQNRLDRWR